MKRGYKPINAVHERDLDNLLDSVGLLSRFHEGKLKCKFCGDTVTIDNIYSVIRDSNTYKVVCTRAQCVALLMEYLEAKRRAKGVNNG